MSWVSTASSNSVPRRSTASISHRGQRLSTPRPVWVAGEAPQPVCILCNSVFANPRRCQVVVSEFHDGRLMVDEMDMSTFLHIILELDAALIVLCEVDGTLNLGRPHHKRQSFPVRLSPRHTGAPACPFPHRRLYATAKWVRCRGASNDANGAGRGNHASLRNG